MPQGAELRGYRLSATAPSPQVAVGERQPHQPRRRRARLLGGRRRHARLLSEPPSARGRSTTRRRRPARPRVPAGLDGQRLRGLPRALLPDRRRLPDVLRLQRATGRSRTPTPSDRGLKARGVKVLPRFNCQTRRSLHRILTEPAPRTQWLDRMVALVDALRLRRPQHRLRGGRRDRPRRLTAFVADLVGPAARAGQAAVAGRVGQDPRRAQPPALDGLRLPRAVAVRRLHLRDGAGASTGRPRPGRAGRRRAGCARSPTTSRRCRRGRSSSWAPCSTGWTGPPGAVPTTRGTACTTARSGAGRPLRRARPSRRPARLAPLLHRRGGRGARGWYPDAAVGARGRAGPRAGPGRRLLAHRPEDERIWENPQFTAAG